MGACLLVMGVTSGHALRHCWCPSASTSDLIRDPHPIGSGTMQTMGGGNCANALTAAARLGLAPRIFTKIGDDGVGDGIIKELNADGVDTSFVIRAKDSSSPFTYIIVDQAGQAAVRGAATPPASHQAIRSGTAQHSPRAERISTVIIPRFFFPMKKSRSLGTLERWPISACFWPGSHASAMAHGVCLRACHFRLARCLSVCHCRRHAHLYPHARASSGAVGGAAGGAAGRRGTGLL
jgi:pfkB family carbohydrate kinase